MRLLVLRVLSAVSRPDSSFRRLVPASNAPRFVFASRAFPLPSHFAIGAMCPEKDMLLRRPTAVSMWFRV